MRLAFYMRISIADGGDDESNSIKNQREFLQAYTDSHLGGREHVEYIDDGYTGANFDRPDVQRLIEDCRKGIVDTILVKDLSRFGRNYIDVGDYVEHIFPLLGVRFISVLDHTDMKASGPQLLDVETSMMNLINTYYVYDTSKKIRSVNEAKMKKGELTTTVTPLGYICEDVHKGWKVEKKGAAGVKRIFGYALEGQSPVKIADRLNKSRTKTPAEITGRGSIATAEPYRKWDSGQVTRILRNEAYTGVLIQGKRQTVVPGKSMRKQKDSSKQYRHEDHHEALVSREDWEKAQAVIKTREIRNRAAEPDTWILCGKVKCAICNRTIKRQANGSLRCNRKGCGIKGTATDLEEEVEKQIGLKRVEVHEKLQEMEKQPKTDPGELETWIQNAKAERAKAYEAYTEERLTEDAFMARMEEIRRQISALEAEHGERKNLCLDAAEKRKRMEVFLKQTQGGLTRQMALDVIDRITLGNDGVENARVEFKEM